MKSSLKKSKVTTLKVQVGNKVQNKKYVAKCNKLFAKLRFGKVVRVVL